MPPGQHWPEAVGSTLTTGVGAGAGGAELGELSLGVGAGTGGAELGVRALGVGAGTGGAELGELSSVTGSAEVRTVGARVGPFD
jgi:hypothetical protein